MDIAWNQEQGHGLGPDPASVHEVAVLRPGGMAAAVHAIPALRHLRKTYPAARITLAVDAASLDLVRACPFVDRCVDIARPSELVVERFDVAVLLDDHQSDSARSPAAEQRVAAGRRSGASSRRPGGGPTLDMIDARCRAAYQNDGQTARHHVNPEVVTRVPEHVRLLRLVWLLGGEEPDATLSLWPSLADRNGAAEHATCIERPLAIVFAGDARSPDHWSIDTFRRVTALIDDHGLQPMLVGSVPAGADARDSWTQGLRVVDLRGIATVGELVGLIERASLYVGADGGPAAIAIALRVQSVVTGAWSVMPSLGTADHVGYLPLDECQADGDGDAPISHGPAETQREQLLGQVMSSASRAHRDWLRTRVR